MWRPEVEALLEEFRSSKEPAVRSKALAIVTQSFGINGTFNYCLIALGAPETPATAVASLWDEEGW
jgi:hypothetical protein